MVRPIWERCGICWNLPLAWSQPPPGSSAVPSQDRRPICCRVRPKEGKTPRRARAAKLPRRRCPQASHPRASVVRLLLCLVCLPVGSSSQQFSADSWDLTKQLRSFLMTPRFPPMPLGQPSALPVSSHISGHRLSHQILPPCNLLTTVSAGLHTLE